MSIICLEGNIAAGKSTLAKTLSDTLGYKVFMEPVVHNPYLELFYQDPKKWALDLQIWIFKQRAETYCRALQHMQSTGQGVILDRSVFSDIVFAWTCTEDNCIDKEGFAQYMKLRNDTLADLPMPSLVLYLDVEPTTCHYRIMNVRKRACESGIPLAYLQSLDRNYK
ncbi:deoxynucleoside kinase, partial [Kipferlia bialata]|eukprot:g11875.t1